MLALHVAPQLNLNWKNNLLAPQKHVFYLQVVLGENVNLRFTSLLETSCCLYHRIYQIYESFWVCTERVRLQVFIQECASQLSVGNPDYIQAFLW